MMAADIFLGNRGDKVYTNKPLFQIINRKCFECRFCVWDYERKQYGCYVGGCIENARFIRYEGIGSETV